MEDPPSAPYMANASELPPGWLICMSRTYNTPYYFNTQTNETVWEPPQAPPETPELAPTKVAVIVPFRDEHPEQQRSAQLKRFIDHMDLFFSRAHVEFGAEYQIYIIEQSADGRKFNRGKLLNAGFEFARQDGCNIFVFHDVDLLPSDSLLKYYCTPPEDMRPMHIARLWDRYSNNPKYVGGIIAFSDLGFRYINGFPNTFWGWGGEDDEMFSRMQEVGMIMDSPPPGSGTITDLEAMTTDQKIDFLRQHKDWKCNVKWEALEDHANWRNNGIYNNLHYEEVKSEQLTHTCTKITVALALNDHWTDNTFELPYDKTKKKGG